MHRRFVACFCSSRRRIKKKRARLFPACWHRLRVPFRAVGLRAPVQHNLKLQISHDSSKTAMNHKGRIHACANTATDIDKVLAYGSPACLRGCQEAVIHREVKSNCDMLRAANCQTFFQKNLFCKECKFTMPPQPTDLRLQRCKRRCSDVWRIECHIADYGVDCLQHVLVCDESSKD